MANLFAKYQEIHRAADIADVEQVKKLIEHGADPDILDDFNHTPIFYACWWPTDNHLAIVKYLIEAGADVNIQNAIGWTALHWAINHRNKKCIELLLQHDAQVNIAGDCNWTPLHEAAQSAYIEGYDLLVAHGADETCKDLWGRTPRDIRVATP